MRNNCSLRKRLLFMVAIPIIIGILIIGGAAYYSAYHEGEEVYDAELVHFSKTLFALMHDGQEKHVKIADEPSGKSYDKYYAFRIWRNGEIISSSENASYFGKLTEKQGFSDRIIGDNKWRFYVYTKNNTTIEVAEEHEVRLDLIRHIMGSIFLPLLAIIPLTILFLVIGLTRGLSPLDELSEAVRGRDANNLDPLDVVTLPRELNPVLDEINSLMRRVNDARRVEKNFTNYAAHEMRTPIAALKTQAQVILRTKDPEKQKELTEELFTTVSRTQRLVEQLLVFARVQNTDFVKSKIDISETAISLIREYAPAAINKEIILEHEIGENLNVEAQEELLETLISNLLDNAVKYTPQNGSVQVNLKKLPEGILLQIQDNGPGVEDIALEHIFDPFFRVTTSSGVSGAGLGLSIVKWICDQLGIRIEAGKGIAGKGFGINLYFS